MIRERDYFRHGILRGVCLSRRVAYRTVIFELIIDATRLYFGGEVPRLYALRIKRHVCRSQFGIVDEDGEDDLRDAVRALYVEVLNAGSVGLRAGARRVNCTVFAIRICNGLVRLFHFGKAFFRSMARARVGLALVHYAHGTRVIVNRGAYLRCLVLPVDVADPLDVVVEITSLECRLLIMRRLGLFNVHRACAIVGGLPAR